MPDEEFDDFFRRERPRLVAFLCKAGFRFAQAQDAADEAMAEAYKKWLSITSPKAWVRTTALRIAVQDSDRRRSGVSRAIAGGWHTPSQDDVARHAEIEEQPQILALLARLPLKRRQVMAWHLDGFTTDEIATAMGITPATVRSHLKHARDELRSVFEQSRLEIHAPVTTGTSAGEVPHHGSAR